MIRVSLHGSTGKMGRALEEILGKSSQTEIVARIHSKSVESDWEALFRSDLVIDFSGAGGMASLLQKYADRVLSFPKEKRPALLSGSTGISKECDEKLRSLGTQIPVLWAPNFSLGVHLVQIALKAWKGNPALRGFQTFITDLHHAEKKDAPSGTALLLQSALGAASPIQSVREGKTVGRHVVKLVSTGETIELCHEAHDRKVFAEGAVFSALELVNSGKPFPKRLLTLDDILS